MKWQLKLQGQIYGHIVRYIEEKSNSDAPLINWWMEQGNIIMREIDWVLDQEQDKAIQKELHSLRQIILKDPKIKNEDENTLRIISLINTFILELEDTDIWEEEEEKLRKYREERAKRETDRENRT